MKMKERMKVIGLMVDAMVHSLFIIGIMYYPNGDRYIGDMLRGKKHGKGAMHYANGEVYRGSWHGDFKEGKGIVICKYNRKADLLK